VNQLSQCPACKMSGGMHKSNCPVVAAINAPNGQSPGQVQMVPPKMIPSDWICPECGYNPPTFDKSEAKGLPITETVTVIVVDGVESARCSLCWMKFVAQHAPALVKREEAAIDSSSAPEG
jgi:hypothetical protein